MWQKMNKEAPRLIRARLYEYHFTDPATRRATGDWWRREIGFLDAVES